MNIIQRVVRLFTNRNPNSEGAGVDLTNTPIDSPAHIATDPMTKAKHEDINDLGANPVFANAVNDIKADIAKLKKSEKAHREAAEADRRLAEANFAAAEDLERRASGLEQPVDTGDNKKRKTIPILISGILILLIIGAVFIKIVMISPPITPTAPPVAAPSGPAVGALMAWEDGSTLVYVDSFFIFQSEVTNYQFSLCVEAGNCLLPFIDGPSPDLNDPYQANSPAQIIGPEGKQAYCEWAGGRLPTEEEIAAIGVDSGSPSADGVDTTSILIGLLSPSTLNGIRCIVDAPHPMAAACQTSAYYLNGAPPKMDHTVTQAGSFCQNGQSFITFDINIPEGGIIQSVNGDCQEVNGNRILCSGAAGTSGEGSALITCNGFLPVDGQMQCLPGYEVNGDLPTQCDFNKLLPAVQNGSGPAVAQLQSSQAQLAGPVSLIGYQPDVKRRDCPSGQRINPATGRCEDLAPCPAGTYLYQPTGLCEAIPTCTGGMVLDPQYFFCDCPSDQYLNRAHGVCEAIPDCPANGFGPTFDRLRGVCATVPLTPLAPDCRREQPGTFFNRLTWSCEPIVCAGGGPWNPNTGECYPYIGNAQSAPCPPGLIRGPDGLCVDLSPHPEPSNECLSGFHFDDSAQCCQTSLPSGRFVGCPNGQAFNPAKGACDTDNIYVAGGKVIHTVQINFDAPSCDVKVKSGGDDGGAAGCTPVCDSKGNNCSKCP